MSVHSLPGDQGRLKIFLLFYWSKEAARLIQQPCVPCVRILRVSLASSRRACSTRVLCLF